MQKIAVFVTTIGIDIGSNKKPYKTNSKHPKVFTIRNFVTDFIKNEISTVAMAA